MTVPKTAMYEQRKLFTGEDKVRRAEELPDVKPEPEAEAVRGAPDQQLRLGTLTSNSSHHLGATSGGDDICHYATSLIAFTAAVCPLGLVLDKTEDDRGRKGVAGSAFPFRSTKLSRR